MDTKTLHQEGWVERPVHLYRDEWGIPHLRAHSVHDAFVGQGYVHAMDRFWQMDASRKQMEGRWAEWVGPAGLPADRLARRLRAAARLHQGLRGPRPRRQGDGRRLHGRRQRLAAPASRPLRVRAAGLAPHRSPGSPGTAWRRCASAATSWARSGSSSGERPRSQSSAPRTSSSCAMTTTARTGSASRPAPTPAGGSRASRTLQEPIRALSLLAGGADTDGGSNNWALAPSRTTTGRPLLAGDPHRVFELPGMYAQLHLGCDEFDAIGFTIPGRARRSRTSGTTRTWPGA